MGTGAVTTGDGSADGSGTGIEPGAGDLSGGEGTGTGQQSTEGPGAGAAGEPDPLEQFKSGLNPVLQSMDAEQINDLFETMSTAVRAAGSAQVTSPEPVAPPPAPEPTPPEEIQEMFDPNSDKFNPKEAVGLLVQENYGPLISSVSANALSGVFAAMKEVAPDFDEFRPQIEEALRNVPPTQWNQQLIAGQYLQAKGARALQQERAEAEKAKGATTLPPSPPTPEGEEQRLRAEMPESEKRVAEKMFPRAADPVGQYIKRLKEYDDGRRTVDVPLGGGKKA